MLTASSLDAHSLSIILSTAVPNPAPSCYLVFTVISDLPPKPIKASPWDAIVHLPMCLVHRFKLSEGKPTATYRRNTECRWDRGTTSWDAF